MIHIWLYYVLELSNEHRHDVVRKIKAACGPASPWVRENPVNTPFMPSNPTPTSSGIGILSSSTARVHFKSLLQVPSRAYPPLSKPIMPKNSTMHINSNGNEVTIEGLLHSGDDSRRVIYVQMTFKENKFNYDTSRKTFKKLLSCTLFVLVSITSLQIKKRIFSFTSLTWQPADSSLIILRKARVSQL